MATKKSPEASGLFLCEMIFISVLKRLQFLRPLIGY